MRECSAITDRCFQVCEVLNGFNCADGVNPTETEHVVRARVVIIFRRVTEYGFDRCWQWEFCKSGLLPRLYEQRIHAGHSRSRHAGSGHGGVAAADIAGDNAHTRGGYFWLDTSVVRRTP
ncbi:hypothetical protein BMS3Bbin04_00330 [bacterium BMS3Bbin04]|nr:hypothetical protein BMS3Bbin04_00330 [bacterium BMS3Bbin04]